MVYNTTFPVENNQNHTNCLIPFQSTTHIYCLKHIQTMIFCYNVIFMEWQETKNKNEISQTAKRNEWSRFTQPASSL